eukprot:TRINITY_DN30923_c1_g2_i2.p1 TRINITY_DN30923_c1_g2~~TRINITY_DN30923_c1_g2_i2.p1  ORF type:complete len:362 (-),score=25.79 TRINITY_DN30923_c1_g2_i2:68-1120(-)
MRRRKGFGVQSVWDYEDLQQLFIQQHIKPIHAKKLLRLLARNIDTDLELVENFPKDAIDLLKCAKLSRCTSKVIDIQDSKDGETTKLLIQLQDGLKVEAVIMRYNTTSISAQNGDGGGQRATLCVSSQVGCQMGCTFCATGSMGLSGNLTTAEIVEQLVHAQKIDNVRNVVFMGMGEPLNNYQNVKQAVILMTDPTIFGIGRRQVTVSTVGVPARIRQLSCDLPGISLAFSLHAPNQQLREEIVPSAKAFKLPELLDTIWQYQKTTNQKIFVEYVMLSGVNDQQEHANEVGKLLQFKDVTLNLIPWNPVYSPNSKFEAPTEQQVRQFQQIVRIDYGIPCTIRQEIGRAHV